MTPTTKTIIQYVVGLAIIGVILLILNLIFSPKAEAQVTDTTVITLSAGAVKAMEAVHGTGWRVRLRTIGRDAMRGEVERTKQSYKATWGEFIFNTEGYEYLTTAERNYIKKTQDSVLARRARIQAAEAAENQRLADSVAAADEAKRLADSITNAQPTGYIDRAIYRATSFADKGIGKLYFKQNYTAIHENKIRP